MNELVSAPTLFLAWKTKWDIGLNIDISAEMKVSYYLNYRILFKLFDQLIVF